MSVCLCVSLSLSVSVSLSFSLSLSVCVSLSSALSLVQNLFREFLTYVGFKGGEKKSSEVSKWVCVASSK